MKSTDKYLIAIVAAIVLVVVVAFGVTLLRPKPAYRAEDAPDGAVYNYLLALQREDYARAYGYLSTGFPGYPGDANAFADAVHDYPWQFGGGGGEVTFQVDPAVVTGDRATVNIQQTVFREGGLFDSDEYTSAFDLSLQREGGSWKLIDADRYWATCWESDKGCK
jgi:hypothetical protein